MTVMMTKVGPRVLPHDVLPDTPAPQKVVQWEQNQAGQPRALTGKPKKAAALAVHLAYSAASGAFYGLARPVVPPLRALPTPAAGVAFGLAVWAVSFQGLLPALGVMSAPPNTRPSGGPRRCWVTRSSERPRPWPPPGSTSDSADPEMHRPYPPLLIGDLMSRALVEQVVVLIGASSGVRRETAPQLAKQGATDVSGRDHVQAWLSGVRDARVKGLREHRLTR